MSIRHDLAKERQHIIRTIAFLERALKADPRNEEGKECLRFAERELKLVKHLEIEHNKKVI